MSTVIGHPRTSSQQTDPRRIFYLFLGKRIAELRKSRGMTQGELGRAVGVSQQAIFAYEIAERRPSVFVLIAMARLFKITTSQLLGIDQVPHPKARRLSPRAARHAERIQALSKTQQRFVVRIIDVLEAQRGERKKEAVGAP